MPIKTIDRIITLIRQIPENKHPDLLAMVENFRNNNGRETQPSSATCDKNKWARFAGTLSDEDAAIMKQAIEEDCE